MWRCEYCRKWFSDQIDCINHARARHSRDYQTCYCLTQASAPISAPPGAVQAWMRPFRAWKWGGAWLRATLLGVSSP